METVQLEGVRTEYERHARDLAQSYLSDAAKLAEPPACPARRKCAESSNPYQAIVDLAADLQAAT